MTPSESEPHGSGYARGNDRCSLHEKMTTVLGAFETPAGERKLEHLSGGRRRRRRPASTREKKPASLDVRVADADDTRWPEGCAGLVMSAIPPSAEPERKISIKATVAEACRLLENNGLFAAFVAPSTAPPWTGQGDELLEYFGREGLRPWGEILWLRPKASAPLAEEEPVWRSPYHLPMRLPPVRIILATLDAFAREGASKPVDQRDYAERYFPGPKKWYRDFNVAWWPMQDTSSDAVLTGEAVARLIAQRGFTRETMVCLSGELDAAIAAIQMGRRCRLVVANNHELEVAKRRLEAEIRRRSETAKS